MNGQQTNARRRNWKHGYCQSVCGRCARDHLRLCKRAFVYVTASHCTHTKLTVIFHMNLSTSSIIIYARLFTTHHSKPNVIVAFSQNRVSSGAGVPVAQCTRVCIRQAKTSTEQKRGENNKNLLLANLGWIQHTNKRRLMVWCSSEKSQFTTEEQCLLQGKAAPHIRRWLCIARCYSGCWCALSLINVNIQSDMHD